MPAPPHYPTSLAAMEQVLGDATKGEVGTIGRSVGGRDIRAIRYGELEPVEHRANLSSALAGRQPQAFFGGETRKKQVLLITAAMHGGEMESIAGVLNLVSLLETGSDLKGQQWPDLTSAAEHLRLIIVPCLNPDGRARIPADDPTVWSEEEFEKYRHGLHGDGTPITWPACKVPHPRDPAQDGFLGGYYNDAGVNALHGVFFSPQIAPETHAALELALAETPDMVLDLHSCGPGPFFIIGSGALPQQYHLRQQYMNGFFRQALRDRLGMHRSWGWGGRESDVSVLDLNSAFYHLCGALPMIFEGPHGAQKDFEYNHEQIVDMYLVMFEAMMVAGAREGFRPRADW